MKRKLITQRHKEEWAFTGMTVIIMQRLCYRITQSRYSDSLTKPWE